MKSRYEHNQSKIQCDSFFYLPDFKLSSRAISLRANSFLRAFFKSTNDLSYRIGQLRTSSANLSSTIFVDREEIWNSVILVLILGQFPREITIISISISTRKRRMFLFLVLMLVLISPQCTLALSCAYACAYLTSVNQALPFVHSYSTRLFTVITSEKAKDLKDGDRFPKRLSLQCESLLVGSVGGPFGTQQQPGR